jgi:hypothetical protein
MGQYKFLDSRYIDCLLGGQIRFGRLMYYRLLEVINKDPWIGDASEGVTVTTIDHVSISPDASRLQETSPIRLGDASPFTSFTITDARFVQEMNDCFVFCFSLGDLTQLTQTMCDPDRPDYAYDGCVSIVEPCSLADTILHTGIVDGKRIKDGFNVSVGRVNYELFVHDFLKEGGVAPADPFRKHPRYSAQQEVRVVLHPHTTSNADNSLTVTVADPTILFKEQFRCLPLPKSTTSKATQGQRSPLDLFNVISAAIGYNDDFRVVPWVTAARDETDRVFELSRDDILGAYWALRAVYPDTQIDNDVVGLAKPFVFRPHLKIYLDRIKPLIRKQMI